MFKKGETFQNWRIEKLLGRGGITSTYLASDIHSSEKRVLKVFSNPASDDIPGTASSLSGATPTSFQEETKQKLSIIKKMDHPGIVKLYEYTFVAQRVVAVFEYVEGKSLEDYLSEKGAVDEPTAIKWISSIAEALGYIHQEGLLHLDIKPSNIILTQNGSLKIIDFGSVQKNKYRSVNDSGTEAYVAPERHSKGKTIDQRADIYSLGVLFCRLLTLEYPYGNQIPNYNQNGIKDISPETKKLIVKCLEKESQHRFNSCQEIVRQLTAISLKTRFKTIRRIGFVGAGLLSIAAMVFLVVLFRQSLPSALNRILENEAMSVSLLLTVLIFFIKLCVRQKDSIYERLFVSLVELPMDILAVVAGYIGALFESKITDHHYTFISLIIVIILIIPTCTMCYHTEYTVKTKAIELNREKIACGACLVSTYFISIASLFIFAGIR